jgi:AcrR family transcriptional regulator
MIAEPVTFMHKFQIVVCPFERIGDRIEMKQAQKKIGQLRKARIVRRRRPDPEESQRKILEAAYELFSDKGYGATTLNDISDRAGVAKGLVSFHFKSKEDVFQAVVRKAMPPLVGRFSILDLADRRSARDLLHSTMEEVYKFLVEGQEARVILRLLISEGRRFPELVKFYHSHVVAPGNAALSRIIERGVKSGEFSIAVSDSVSRVLIGPFIGALFWQLLFSDIEKIDLKQLFEVHIRLALHGLVAGHPEEGDKQTDR